MLHAHVLSCWERCFWFLRHLHSRGASHQLWAQRPLHHRGLCRIRPGVRAADTQWLRLRWRHHRSDAPSWSAEEEPITLKKKACRLVCRRQTVMIERGDQLFAHLAHKFRVPKKLRDTTAKANRWNSLGKTNRANLVADCQAEIRKHEFQADYDRRSIQKLYETIASQKEEICRAHQRDDVDKVNNFFLNSYWSKIGIFVKLIRKASVKWNNWSDFKAQLST